MAGPNKPAAKILVELPNVQPGSLTCGRGKCTALDCHVSYLEWCGTFGVELAVKGGVLRAPACLAAEKAAVVAEAAVKVAEAMREYVAKG